MKKEYVNAWTLRTKSQYEFVHGIRSDPTNTEAKLWRKLRGNNFGVKFRRQHLVGSYIVDFYCNELRLIIEIDGDVHEQDDVREKDNMREQWLIEQGYNIVRYTSHQIRMDIDNVLQDLSNVIDSLAKNSIKND